MNNQLARTQRIKSYVGRNSRITASQRHACDHLYQDLGIPIDERVDFATIFARNAPTYLEIGFGSGQSLLAAAQSMPEYNFIGVETHQPGIGSLLNHVRKVDIHNLRVCNGDVVDVLEKVIADQSLAGVQIFFPDPWPKRKHHERRLIQPAFLPLLIQKLAPLGSLHLATDWQDYAQHMLRVLSQCEALTNNAGAGKYATRSPFRPIITKFEQRALKDGRGIWELQFTKD